MWPLSSDFTGSDVSSGSALSRLAASQPVFGALQTIPSAALTEIAIGSGYDFIILDCEHGVLDEPAILASLQVIDGSPAFAVVRVRPRDFEAVGRYLDHGADGILLPDVRTAAETQAFVDAATFGPRGTRSSSGTDTPASRYGAGKSPLEPVLLLAMVESADAVARINAIAATPGLGGLVIGPHDLAADLGAPDDFATSAYQAAFVRVEQAAIHAGVVLGTRTHAGFDAERLIDAGHRFILVCGDIIALRDGYRAHLETARQGQARQGETQREKASAVPTDTVPVS
jgi:4-hydroxy-2-oxoheptanedioate aldolase